MRRKIHARTKRHSGGIMQVARHDIDESQGGVAEPCRRRIAETDQNVADLDAVPGRLNIETLKEIRRRGIIEAEGIVERLLGSEHLRALIDEIAPARSKRSLAAAIERHSRRE